MLRVTEVMTRRFVKFWSPQLRSSSTVMMELKTAAVVFVALHVRSLSGISHIYCIT